MSLVEVVQADQRPAAIPSSKGGWRSKYKSELLERAADDCLTQQAMEALGGSEGWQRWLGVRVHLGNLALHNQLLVAHQRPDARRVGGRRGWRTLGYKVRSGEKPIRVWGRLPASKKALREWEETGSEPGSKPAGEVRLVSVFDQDQVRRLNGSPEPAEEESHSQASDSHKLICLLGQLIKFASEIGAPVNFEPIEGVVRAYHAPGTGEIVIDASPDFPPAARADRLVYELANVLIDEDVDRRGLKFHDGERELVSHSAAQCVCVIAGSAGYREPVAVPAGWELDGALALRYAALVHRVVARFETALVAGLRKGHISG